MKISTKGRYGLIAMLDLTLHSGGNQVSLFSIAERQHISMNYLEQIFSSLRKAGLVSSIKGADGGYMLANRPSQIHVGSILRCLEGNLHVVEDETTSDNPVQTCIRENVWQRMNDSLEQVVDSITLEDLVERYQETAEVPMFYI